MCVYDKTTTNKTHMPLGILKKIIDQSKEFKYPIHWFHDFGEPLLCPDLEEALSYFRKNG
jgi:MoaA/NifB/PqqE/SkfB family radical SAM enzyme